MITYQRDKLYLFESALFRTSTTLVVTKDCLILVDPTWLPTEIALIRAKVEAMRGDKPLYLVFTHSDYDHIIGYGAFPTAKVIATQAFVDNPVPERSLQEILDFDDAYYIVRDYPIVYPEVDYCVDHDGQQLQIGETILHFYLAPGHNPDGLFMIVEALGLWVAGDYLSNIEFPYLYDSYQAYWATLEKVELILARHKIEIMVAGHGDPAFTVEEIRSRKEEAFQYLRDCRSAIEQQAEFDLAALLRRYQFPKVMTRFHEANLSLIKKELGGNSLL